MIRKGLADGMRKIAFFLLTAGLSGLYFLYGLSGSAVSAPSLISSMKEAAKSMVKIKAETISVHRGKPVGFLSGMGGLIAAQPVRMASREKKGSGIIIDSSGVILTNFHTVQGANRIQVFIGDQPPLDASVFGVFSENDIVLLRVSPSTELSAVELGDSDTLRIGDTIYYIGSSPTLRGTFGEGKIRGLLRSKTKNSEGVLELRMIQVGFDIYYADSGAPVLDREGKLLGIFAARLKNRHNSTFAIPSNLIKKALDESMRPNTAQ